MNAAPELIGAVHFLYRQCKSAQTSRMAMRSRLIAFARVHLTPWDPTSTQKERKKASDQAKRAINAMLDHKEPLKADRDIVSKMTNMVNAARPAIELFANIEAETEKEARELALQFPAVEFLQGVRGVSEWSLACLIGEAGDIGGYPGPRYLFKRLGLAPDSAYPRGEKKKGRMIPRATRGRVMGIIAEPLFRAQLRGERGPNGEVLTKESEKGQLGNIPAHPIGPYGAVYSEAKARHLAAGKEKFHAHNLARRAMIKALIHDVHRAWNGLPPDYVFTGDEACQSRNVSQAIVDRPSPTPEIRA